MNMAKKLNAEEFKSSKPATWAKAESIGGQMQQSGFQFDPTIIITIILGLIELFKNCDLGPKEAADRARSPRMLDRLRFKRVLRQKAKKDRDELETAFGQASVTDEEMAALFAEAG